MSIEAGFDEATKKNMTEAINAGVAFLRKAADTANPEDIEMVKAITASVKILDEISSKEYVAKLSKKIRRQLDQHIQPSQRPSFLINFSLLPSVSLEGLHYLPPISAVYFAMQSDKCLYIGQSENLYDRWKRHNRFNQIVEFETITDKIKLLWIPCEIANLKNVEKQMIKNFKPPLNSQLMSEIQTMDKNGTP